MNNREFVEKFIAERKKIAVKFIVIQSVLDIAVALAFGMLIARAMENGRSILGHIIILFLVLSSTMISQIKIYFGSFKNLRFQNDIISTYNMALDELNKIKADIKSAETEAAFMSAQEKFDETIDELAEKIKADFPESL